MATDLNTVANVSTALAVLAALVFGIIQVLQAQRKRRESLALEAVHAAQSEHVAQAIQTVLALPQPVDERQILRSGPSARQAVAAVEYSFETLGWMVHQRLIPPHDLDLLMGGTVRELWKRLHVLADERRRALPSPGQFEWLQWLAERMDADPAPGKALGAYEAFRDWKR